MLGIFFVDTKLENMIWDSKQKKWWDLQLRKFDVTNKKILSYLIDLEDTEYVLNSIHPERRCILIEALTEVSKVDELLCEEKVAEELIDPQIPTRLPNGSKQIPRKWVLSLESRAQLERTKLVDIYWIWTTFGWSD